MLFRGLVYLMAAGIVLQFYFAGLAAFGVTSFVPHAATGWILLLASLLLLIMSAIVRLGRQLILICALLFLAHVLQPVLAFLPRDTMPAVAAVHPVNALVIAGLLSVVLRRAPRGDATVPD